MVMTLYTIVPVLAVMGVSVYVLVLLIRALRKYLRTAPVRAEKAETAKTLGAVLKQHRTACKMSGVRRGVDRREPAGGIQVGERRVRPEHIQSARAGEAVRHRREGAARRDEKRRIIKRRHR